MQSFGRRRGYLAASKNEEILFGWVLGLGLANGLVHIEFKARGM